MEKLVSVRTYAKSLNKKISTVYQHVRLNKIRSKKIGRMVFIFVDASFSSSESLDVEETYMNPVDFSVYMNVAQRSVQRWIKDKKIDRIRIESSWFIPISQVNANRSSNE